MNKINITRKCLVFVVIILFIGACFVPSISGNKKQSKKMENTSLTKYDTTDTGKSGGRDTVMLDIEEVINLNYDGRCVVQFDMFMPATPFADIYQKFLNFSVDTDIDIEDAEPVPLYAQTYATLVSHSNNWTSNQWYTYPTYNNVKEQIVEGIIQEQFHTFGILIDESSVDIRMWGVYGGVCGIRFHASGDFQHTWEGSDWAAYIGPIDANRSFDRASFNLLKLGYLQDMMRSSNFAGHQKYISNWDTLC